MQRLDTDKLHVSYLEGSTADGPVLPRCYTLTHSDATGDLYLSIGLQHNRQQVAGFYTRLMRDEVLAEWRDEGSELALHVHCHVSGGVIAGRAAWRDAIFRRELPLVLEALRFAESRLVEVESRLDTAPIRVHFHSTDPAFDRVEAWGVLADFR